MKAFFSTISLLLAPVVAPVFAQGQNVPVFHTPDQEQAKIIADTIYNTWRVAMIRGNEQAWRSSTTLSRQNRIRNLIVSQRGRFPHDFFRMQQEPPNLANFKFVGALAGPDKRTLAATYLGRVQLGDGQAEDNAIVLEFVHEYGKWKFDQSRFFNLKQLPKVKQRLAAKDLSVLKEQDGFHPYLTAPTVPPACPAPQLIGKVFVDAPGRSIEMNINGISAHEFADERRADVISGGLRRGKNTISYTIETDSKKTQPMAIGLFVMPETEGNRPACVFEHITDSGDAAKGGSFSFYISNDMIAAMNPAYKGNKPTPYRPVPLKTKK